MTTSHIFGFGELGFFAVLIPFLYFLALAANLAVYLFYSLGLYHMANNTGMKNPWLAWLPFCRDYLTGAMVDRSEGQTFGRKSKWRFILPAVRAAVVPIIYIFSASFVFSFMLMDETGGVSIGSQMIMLLGFLFVLLAISIAKTVVHLICLYKLFVDYEPSRAGLYTVISFFGLGCIPLFLSRHNVPVGVAGLCQPRQPHYSVPPHSQSSSYAGETYHRDDGSSL